MSQANVVTAAGNITWYTDKCAISTGNTAVTFNVYAVALGTATPVGNIYSNAVSVAANSREEIYVGAGNKLTIIGANFTAQELGTQSSAQYSVFNTAGT
jgi:hypothetical protein